jgi:hypothetical protein
MRSVLVVCVSFVLTAPSAARAQGRTWGPSVGVLLGTFDSQDLSSLNTYAQKITGYDVVSLTGRSWDVCAARGGSRRSQLRLCYTEVHFADGSELSNTLSSGVTQSGKVRGFKIDREFRIGPHSWPIAPLVSIHGGLGKVSGDAVFTIYNPTSTGDRGPVRDQETHQLSEYLGVIGPDWTFIGGGSVGLTASAGKHVTVNVGIWGVELPGAYKGQLQLTYWP